MASTLKHLRSSTADKRPTASGLADGQIAINTASGTPAMFFKDNNGGVVKVGPAHVGASAPNAVPAGAAGNSIGELWINDSTTIHGLNYYNGSSFHNLTPSGTETTAGLVELATAAETQAGTDAIRAVTPSGLQSKVSDSISTTSSTTIASATAVKTAYDLANAALPRSGGRVTGNLEIGPSGSLSFEGSSDDGFETTLAVVNPTADRTITFPNTTGTVVTTGDTGTVTSTMIANGTIVDADINVSAAIALSKLATGTLPSGITVNSSNIVDGSIVNADVSASAAIAYSKLALSSGIVNTDISASAAIALSKLATGALPSGITIASSNIVDGTIVDADINASAAITGTKVSPNFGSQNIVTTGTASAAALIPAGSGVPANGLYLPSANTVAIAANSAERLRISAGGRVSIGAPALSSFLAGNNPFLQQHGTTGQNASALLGNWQTTATGPTYYFFKSQSGTVDTFGAIASGTPIGVLTFVGDNGTQPVTAGSIRCDADGTPGAEPSMPGRLVFLTTSVGGSTPQERMRITSDGTVRATSVLSAGSVATENTAPTNSNVTATATASSLLGGIRTGTPTANIDLQLPTGTNMDAAFGDLQNNQAFQWSVINLAAATHVITVTANTDHTVVGNMAVAATTSGRFLTRKTAANTFVTYRIS